MHLILETILRARGIPETEWDAFVHPDFEIHTHDGSLMKDMDKAVQRLAEAISQQQHILVFGDYDADGIPGTAVFTRALRGLGAQVTPIIPRRSEGYGLTAVAVARIRALNPGVIVTIDNGSTAVAEVQTLQQEVCDVICIDHHEAPDEHKATPFALVNPKQSGCEYPFRDLCAAALAWKVCWQLYRFLGRETAPLKWSLDLVGLSTIADMVPLVGENRVLAYWGLVVMRKSKNHGLRALAAQAGLAISEITAVDVGFKLAPRINAPGRLHAEDGDDGTHISLQLLLADTTAQATAIAEQLGVLNSRRQALVQQHRDVAWAQVTPGSAVQIIGAPDWSTGVIGLVASAVCEREQAVAIALALESGVVKGSLRAPLGASCLDVLSLLEPLLARSGGHVQAAGLTGKPEVSLDQMLNIGRELVASYQFTLVSRDEVVTTLEVAECTTELARELAALEPYGVGFPVPCFAVSGVVSGYTRMGAEGAHARFLLTSDGVSIKVIAFRFPEGVIANDQQVTIEAELQLGSWNGSQYPELLYRRSRG